MQIIDFNPETALAITVHDSHNVSFRRIAAQIPNCHIGIMYLEPGGVVGYHQATGDQLFLVVQGIGWVTGSDHQRKEIAAGQAVFWQDGEWHESGSNEGMIVLVIEAENLGTRL